MKYTKIYKKESGYGLVGSEESNKRKMIRWFKTEEERQRVIGKHSLGVENGKS